MKFFYKIILKNIFDIIYGKISKFNEKYNKDILNITYLQFFNKNYKLYELTQGRIFTDCNTNVAYITKNNKLTN